MTNLVDPKHKEQVISAIKSLGYKVTVADLAAKTGLSIFESTRQINTIALECQGIMKVTDSGNIIYDFDPSFEQHYVTNVFKRQIKQLAKILFDIAYFIVRISFGVLLIASFITVAIVFALALVIILISSGELADGDGDGGDGNVDIFDMSFDFYDIGNLFIFFNWNLFDTKHDQSSDDDISGKEDQGFFYNCYSFLFGNGDPNANLDTKKWQYIAESIRQHGGVVTAEQLSPYTAADPRDDNAVFPVLVRFNGVPQVSPNGNIIYAFPQLQTVAASIIKTSLPDYFVEKYWQFTTQPLDRLFPIYFFGGANLAGCYCLWQHLHSMTWLQPCTAIIGFMLSYAVFFLGFPVIRQIGNIVINAYIDYRNKYRQACFEHLKDSAIQPKLLEAKQFARRVQDLNKEKIVYSTAEDILDQEFKN